MEAGCRRPLCTSLRRLDTLRQALDPSAILSACREGRGCAPCHPGMTMALLLPGCRCGGRSSRQLPRACRERPDIMAVSGPNQSNVRTISEVRKRHLAAPAGARAGEDEGLRPSSGMQRERLPKSDPPDLARRNFHRSGQPHPAGADRLRAGLQRVDHSRCRPPSHRRPPAGDAPTNHRVLVPLLDRVLAKPGRTGRGLRRPARVPAPRHGAAPGAGGRRRRQPNRRRRHLDGADRKTIALPPPRRPAIACPSAVLSRASRMSDRPMALLRRALLRCKTAGRHARKPSA